MNLANGVFCAASLLAVWLLTTLMFPLAAKSKSDIEFAKTPQSAELFDDVDLGDFGEVPVLDLVDYYIENPPAPNTAVVSEKATRFQGC